jgi:hypothetical protein
MVQRGMIVSDRSRLLPSSFQWKFIPRMFELHGKNPIFTSSWDLLREQPIRKVVGESKLSAMRVNMNYIVKRHGLLLSEDCSNGKEPCAAMTNFGRRDTCALIGAALAAEAPTLPAVQLLLWCRRLLRRHSYTSVIATTLQLLVSTLALPAAGSFADAQP